MTFWDLYFPILAALITTFIITELFHWGLSIYYANKQEKLRVAFEESLKEKGIDPVEFIRSMSQGGIGFPTGFPSASGEGKDTEVSSTNTGYYL